MRCYLRLAKSTAYTRTDPRTGKMENVVANLPFKNIAGQVQSRRNVESYALPGFEDELSPEAESPQERRQREEKEHRDRLAEIVTRKEEERKAKLAREVKHKEKRGQQTLSLVDTYLMQHGGTHSGLDRRSIKQKDARQQSFDLVGLTEDDDNPGQREFNLDRLLDEEDEKQAKKSLFYRLMKAFASRTGIVRLYDLAKAKLSHDPRQMSLFDNLDEPEKPTPSVHQVSGATHKEQVNVAASTRTDKKTGKIIPVSQFVRQQEKRTEEAKVITHNITKPPHINTILDHTWIQYSNEPTKLSDDALVNVWVYGNIAAYLRKNRIDPAGYVHSAHHHIIPQIASDAQLESWSREMKKRGLDKKHELVITIPIEKPAVRQVAGVPEKPDTPPEWHGRSDYSAHQQARIDRLHARAEKKAKEAESRNKRANEMASIIPLGQPILVGHHSEGRDRRYRSKIQGNYRAAFEASEEAKRLASAAHVAENNPSISSDDPEAVTLLKQKIAKLEEHQEHMKKLNAAWRKFKKDPASLDKSDLSDSEKAALRRYVPEYSWSQPGEKYELTNNAANIARLHKRVDELSTRSFEQAQSFSDPTSGISLHYNTDLNRIQIEFPGKPAPEKIKELKSMGFHWSPSEGMWQRQLNNTSKYWAHKISGIPAPANKAYRILRVVN